MKPYFLDGLKNFKYPTKEEEGELGLVDSTDKFIEPCSEFICGFLTSRLRKSLGIYIGLNTLKDILRWASCGLAFSLSNRS